MKTRWVAVVGVIVSIVAGILASYLQFVDRKFVIEAALHEETVIRRLYERKEFTERLESALLQRVRDEIVNQANLTNPLVAAEKLVAMEKKIEAVHNQTLALRQAINPTKPEEVLTIARLTDEVKDVREDLSIFRKQMNNQQQSFQTSVVRELKSSSDSTKLILLVLAPLVLNFLYTVWKDIRSAGTKDDS